MATQKSPESLTSNLFIIHSTAMGATSESDLGPGASTLYQLKIDNTANASAASFLKLYNAAAPTIGTTVPDMVIRAGGGATVTLQIPEGISFGTAISAAVVTAGGTGGITSPTSSVIVDLVITTP